MSEGHFMYEGELKGHRGWVTSMAAPQDNNNQFMSASRDGTILNWQRNTLRGAVDESDSYATPIKRYEGHSGFVQDVALSHDAQYAVPIVGVWRHAYR